MVPVPVFGGVDSDDIVVTVSGSSGPFTLTSPNGGEVVGESKSIRWDVSKTDEAPINVSLVEILLSTKADTLPESHSSMNPASLV